MAVPLGAVSLFVFFLALCVPLSMHHVQPLGSGCTSTRTQEVAEPESWSGPMTDQTEFTRLVTRTWLRSGHATYDWFLLFCSWVTL